ncbi:diguanylate cyclase domain-containing protein [uncultured Desulfobacter sp.]|uniref:diguanylate cyclase domain-containing protein n=1 Tax=uncultured Desulfobacter sp. TaxID=240139 RepID=UPI002AA76417|nr:diguanylate cyclase [uncultured Desulfobacter sp.]
MTITDILPGMMYSFKVAGALKSITTRPDDHLFRVGGEDSAILFPGTDAAGSRQCLEKIRTGIDALEITHKYNDASAYITVSFRARNI